MLYPNSRPVSDVSRVDVVLSRCHGLSWWVKPEVNKAGYGLEGECCHPSISQYALHLLAGKGRAGFLFEYWDGTTPPEQQEHRWHLNWGRALPGGQVTSLQVKAELAHVQVGEDWPQKYENRKNFNLLLLGGPITIVQVRHRLLKTIHNRTGTKSKEAKRLHWATSLN